jgi:hypothetical protein
MVIGSGRRFVRLLALAVVLGRLVVIDHGAKGSRQRTALLGLALGGGEVEQVEWLGLVTHARRGSRGRSTKSAPDASGATGAISASAGR